MSVDKKLAQLLKLKEVKEQNAISDDEEKSLRLTILNSRADLTNFLPNLDQISKFSWPMVVIVLLVLFYSPIKFKLLEASKISIGDFSIEVREKLEAAGSPELIEGLNGLSRLGIEKLIDIGDSYIKIFSVDSNGDVAFIFDDEHKGFNELDEQNLLAHSNTTGVSRSYSELITFAKTLPHKKTLKYLVKSNGYTALVDEPPQQKYKIVEVLYFDTTSLSKDSIEVLTGSTFTLNDRGQTLWKQIAQVVVEQLSVDSK